MKLIEIKNSLAKLYYETSDFKLVLSDFLTIDDGNQKILAQVVSIESTNKDSTNCAVLKFSLNLNEDGSFSAYNGYVPTLDALVSQTPAKVIQNIFSDNINSIKIGQLTNSSAVQITLKDSFIDNFLYIQADKYDRKKELLSKILDFNTEQNNKTIYADFEGINEFENSKNITLGKEFKLPIDSNILNYIYENDLTGLTVEQKTIVQDIILEIQEYISTLDSGYIPFDTLLSVVNEIYEADKSTGVILFRNKLLKYKQYGIFASTDDEIYSLNNAVSENTIITLNLSNTEKAWQTAALSYVINNIKEKYCLIFEALEEVITKEQLGEIYKKKNIQPILMSKYENDIAPVIKAFSKNLILFKPLEQQRAFATYNSFLNKLSDTEFIVSGDCTYYTPLIIKELPEKFEKVESAIHEDLAIDEKIKEIQTEENNSEELTLEPVDEELAEDIEQNILTAENDNLEGIGENLKFGNTFEESDIQELIDLEDSDLNEDNSDSNENELFDSEKIEEEDESDQQIPNILEESIEDEIAKDVDQMFYAESEQTADNLSELESLIEEDSEEKMVNIDVELVSTIDADEDMLEDELFSDEEEVIENNEPDVDDLEDFITDENEEEDFIIEDADINENTVDEQEIRDDSIYNSLMEDDLDLIETVESQPDYIENEIYSEESAFFESTPLEELSDSEEKNINTAPRSYVQKEEQTMHSNIPVYNTELDTKEHDDSLEIAEGNIVYHEKYGRGVVEQFMNYGNKRFCSILFDNVGRRLMDPKLAGLKQM